MVKRYVVSIKVKNLRHCSLLKSGMKVKISMKLGTRWERTCISILKWLARLTLTKTKIIITMSNLMNKKRETLIENCCF